MSPPSPGYRKHPQHTAAVPDERWQRAGELAREQGTDRSKLINGFLAWYCREPGARMPKRP